jgi:hypothetical protein
VGGLLRVELEDDEEDLLKAAKWIHWATITFRGLEKVLCSWVCPLVGILSRSTSATARGWRVPKLTIWSL